MLTLQVWHNPDTHQWKDFPRLLPPPALFPLKALRPFSRDPNHFRTLSFNHRKKCAEMFAGNKQVTWEKEETENVFLPLWQHWPAIQLHAAIPLGHNVEDGEGKRTKERKKWAELLMVLGLRNFDLTSLPCPSGTRDWCSHRAAWPAVDVKAEASQKILVWWQK